MKKKARRLQMPSMKNQFCPSPHTPGQNNFPSIYLYISLNSLGEEDKGPRLQDHGGTPRIQWYNPYPCRVWCSAIGRINAHHATLICLRLARHSWWAWEIYLFLSFLVPLSWASCIDSEIPVPITNLIPLSSRFPVHLFLSFFFILIGNSVSLSRSPRVSHSAIKKF